MSAAVAREAGSVPSESVPVRNAGRRAYTERGDEVIALNAEEVMTNGGFRSPAGPAVVDSPRLSNELLAFALGSRPWGPGRIAEVRRIVEGR